MAIVYRVQVCMDTLNQNYTKISLPLSITTLKLDQIDVYDGNSTSTKKIIVLNKWLRKKTTLVSPNQ